MLKFKNKKVKPVVYWGIVIALVLYVFYQYTGFVYLKGRHDTIDTFKYYMQHPIVDTSKVIAYPDTIGGK